VRQTGIWELGPGHRGNRGQFEGQGRSVMFATQPALAQEPLAVEVAQAPAHRGIPAFLTATEASAPSSRLLAQSSAGPSLDLGSSAGPVSGSINPYTATPGSALSPSSSGNDGLSASPSVTTFGTQQDQSGSSGAGQARAASPNSSTTGARSRTDRPSSGTGAATVDRGNVGTGVGPIGTGNAVTAPPPPSLTDGDNQSPTDRARDEESGSGPSGVPSADPSPPPPPPTPSGSTSTR